MGAGAAGMTIESKVILRNFAEGSADLNGKSVLVTGATGSFGRKFVDTVTQRFNPRKVIVYSRDELKQYEMGQERPGRTAVRYFIGDVRDRERLTMAMRGVDYVIHAAALKQVPAAEYNPMECVNTNVMGADNVVQAAIRAGVERVVALSTDKAVNPINLYGASKLASDKIFVAGNNLSGKDGPKFSVVRYGNVIGSRGSVVPLFRRLLAEGAETLPITDPRMTRFWITLEQGVDFVLSSLGSMKGGEVFVPKIPSMSMPDLARAIAPELPQKVIGIRPGEKLHEVLISRDDARHTVELDDRYIITPAFHWWTNKAITIPGAHQVEESFHFTSEDNREWLDAAGLSEMLALSGV